MAGNVLGYYNPLFYANEALIQLEKALGMAGRIHRGYDAERRSFGKGEYVNIKRPAKFKAEDAPSTAQDIETSGVSIKLDNWREVKFKLSDKELAFTTEQIIAEHIAPAAYALADDLDGKLTGLYKTIPWYYDLASTTVVTDITGPYQVLFDNNVPMDNLHYMINGKLQNGFQSLSAFNQAYAAGQQGLDTLQRGSLGNKFGFEIFANQNVKTHTSGVAADSVGAMNAEVLKGGTTIVVKSVTNAGTFKAGDTLVIAGNTQRYVITADATVDTTVSLSIFPALVADAAADAVVTINLKTGVGENLAFHRNAFALATAPLSDIGAQLGAKVASITDPKSGLSIRSRLYYVGNSSEVHVALDWLYGFTTLDPNLAVRCRL